ncbi:MAG: LLM class flavin-dependent oxidoreductase [Deltaproteobacteria bacterium]|nr:LLM class flavin-dependent oxidoreductase [Deltaproteobacteria bacterium]MBI3390158.1 LLM class flavin-dependent oxidoreductase [Deltaproteobacteria bacterium]
MNPKPAVSLAAMPGRRHATIELAQEIERRGFAGIYCPSFNDGVGLCEALALSTKTIRFGTGIANIYTRHPFDYAQTASLIHELSNGRFAFGIGVSHGPVHKRLSIATGKPLADTRRFVEQLREGGNRQGELPPVVLATLRKPMVRLAAEIAQGAMWANAARSHMAASLSYLPAEKRGSADFFIGNMIPTCISDDRNAAAAVNRKTLTGYILLPNYQNYWIEAGYEDEMRAIQQAIAKKEFDKIPALMSERWLADTTLYGSVKEVRDGLEAWYAAGISTPILVPSSTAGGQMQAFKEFLAAFE